MNTLKIIGSGMIAKSLENQPHGSTPVCFFASGVSNSTCTDVNEYLREKDLLEKTLQEVDQDLVFVYFSTCSVYDNKQRAISMYIQHKLDMERIVSSKRSHIIFRLPQVAGFSKNRFTLLNYIRNCIINESKLTIQTNSIRNIIDVEDVAAISYKALQNTDNIGKIINIANPTSISVEDLVTAMENILGKFAIRERVQSGSNYMIDTSFVQGIAPSLHISFDKSYIERTLKKYYSPHLT